MIDSSYCIYQIVTDRFFDARRDNHPTDEQFCAHKKNLRKYFGGDWLGITEKIKAGYFKSLGVNVLLISQPVENVKTCLNDEQGTSAYHGYWPKDFLRVNPYFGTLEEFDEFIATAHEHHIKVCIDFTPNHTSPALETVPHFMENGGLYHDGKLIANYSQDRNYVFLHNGGTDFTHYEKDIYQNLYDLASFNHLNPKVDMVLKEAITFWIGRGIDGVRIDAAKHISPAWLKSFVRYVQGIRPIFIFGEWFLLEHQSSQDYAHFANNSGMSLLNFSLCHALRKVFINGESLEVLAKTINENRDCIKWLNDQVIFLDNHDMSRFTQNEEESLSTDLALTVLFMLPGIPQIYYGTEHYLVGGDDPYNRAMMPHFELTSRASLLIAELNRLRKSNIALIYGSVEVISADTHSLVFERKLEQHTALVCINRSNEKKHLTSLKTALPSQQYENVLNKFYSSGSIRVNNSGLIEPFTVLPQSIALFTYSANEQKPLIYSFSPRIIAPSHTLNITGINFGHLEGHVYLGEIMSPIIEWSNEQISVQVPNVTAGKHEIKIQTAKSQTSTYIQIEASQLVTVRVIIHEAYTEYGVSLYALGNVHELGSWDERKAVGPFFNQIVHHYPSWYIDLSLPANTEIELAIIKIETQTRTIMDCDYIRKFKTPKQGTDQVVFEWRKQNYLEFIPLQR